ncbi:UNVERIFIED_CONTAM: Retrovirus-related Pol polyprotein from transposon RE2 [Sesamum calycinum]|uniref:Retrovirus-related Pol polyprotein from transposon RE2 n=1 Tax=Sesamum calycinum TaxID=2727403 RepID=A0AAW2NT62_9LAMI
MSRGLSETNKIRDLVCAVLRRSTRESRPPKRYGFVGLTSQLDNDPRTYGEAISDINSDKWLEFMKYKMDSMGSNQLWTLVDPPKDVKPVGCKWVYKRKLGADEEVTAFKAKLVPKGYTQRPRVNFEETYSPVPMAKSIRILLAIEAFALGQMSLSFEWDKQILGIRRGGALERGQDHTQLDDDNAKSQSDFIFKLNGGVVAWKSSKEATTADSTTEAEYIAA